MLLDALVVEVGDGGQRKVVPRHLVRDGFLQVGQVVRDGAAVQRVPGAADPFPDLGEGRACGGAVATSTQ
ncbi:hypothetical protein AB0B83_00650 [Micromonospora sp. NPDC049060]|uniref:hypothetical protein n=1 Tax=Micromonospora sp. NPDC049060 TaxID=3154828 RepID=UPI0034049F56